MTLPHTRPHNYLYLRRLQEAAARRRLDIAKILRDAPATTNKQLAAVLNVSRNTITSDRRIMVEDLKSATLTETEQLRQAMVDKLESLNKELALHRKDGKLPVGVIHEMMLVNRSIIELLVAFAEDPQETLHQNRRSQRADSVPTGLSVR